MKFSGEVIHPDNLLGKDSGAVQFLEIIRLTIETNVFILIYLVSLFFLLVWLLLHCLVKMPNSHFSSITDFFNCLLITIFKRDPYLIIEFTPELFDLNSKQATQIQITAVEKSTQLNYHHNWRRT